LGAILIIETVSISSLSNDPDNARLHNDKSIKAIAESLKTFGQRKPIVIHNKMVIAGNGTLAAAKYLEWETILTVEVPEDWTSEQAHAFALADNRTAELAEWDQDILATRLYDLEIKGFDVVALGFDKLPIPVWTGQDSTHEIEIDKWEFTHTCPKCKFQFNDNAKT